MKNTTKTSKQKPRRVRGHLRRYYSTVGAFSLHSLIDGLHHAGKSPTELRTILQQVVEDEPLWDIIDEAHATQEVISGLSEQLQKRLRKIRL